MKAYHWISEESQTMLERGYLLKGETVQDAVKRITNATAIRLKKPALQSKFEELISYGWMSLSSPVWANMGTDRGLPISCFGSYTEDTIEGITHSLSESIMMTKMGGGTSGYFGALRPRGTKIKDNGASSGPISFLKMFDAMVDTISQGAVRRGAYAAYLDIDHPDCEELLNIKDVGNAIQNLFFGVCIPDYWMQEMIDGDTEKRSLWAKVLKSRQAKGLPYIQFSDTVNKNAADVYQDKGMRIYNSNLCSEISLPANKEESFVCCLASMNMELYDEWKDTDAVETAIWFLDGIMEEFIAKSKGMPYMERPYNFAKRHRALGLGVMGYHAYLQKNSIPFESFEAKQFTASFFKELQGKTQEASRKLAEEFGEPEVLKGYGRRNTTLLAIAPTTSSSSILGQTSPGIEPYNSNYYKVGLAKGNFTRRNKFLKSLLAEKGKDLPEIWSSILMKHGSVQHLDCLTEHEKAVFKTFKEINPYEIITQASIRQKYIDQSQSLNINISPDIPIKEVNQLMIEAWKLGVKSLYYQRSESVAHRLVNSFKDSCEACAS
ncbi:ribonucleoside-diphosphate reductase subunit alpha [Aquimarina hainanensis]|uniref:Ribonucleoside-diphosphate reductase subunit alpha n=1 Tax=Aquimarina hainanensis TaxID=1578017 RepID=A0ABW5N5Z6_9FLAO|nr:ribonucleoside-diphosphate reductase subunit alpha [Aquimarina sp. TRL1]QKX03868.1 ribonucleoside-diphosphate reductase subunit alpha [Aquimarina sp. TRL1]